MRHKKPRHKLGRPPDQRKALVYGLIRQLILHKRARTTLARAKAIRPWAEKMLTYGKKAVAAENDIEKKHFYMLAMKRINNREAIDELFNVIAPAHKDRNGGYTRIIKLGRRMQDSAKMALIEWVDTPKVFEEEEEESEAKKSKEKATVEA